MNRHERRSKESAFKKQVKQVIKSDNWGDWEDFNSIAFNDRFKNGIKFYQNLLYSVQVYNDNGQIVIGIRRHDQSSNVPWSHKQRIKNELFGLNALFVECFPPESELIDEANLFWLFEMCADKNVFDLRGAIAKK